MTRPALLAVLAFSLTACPPPDPNVGSPPVAVDDEAEVRAGEDVDIDVLLNDYDPDGSQLTLDEVGEPSGGTAEIDRDEVTYTADADFAGNDAFTYTISDVNGNTATATVTVEVIEALGLVILSPEDGDEYALGDDVYVSFEVTGCEVTSPSNNPDGCHLHRFIDGTAYDGEASNTGRTGWYGTTDMRLVGIEAGEHVISVRLHKNDGTDGAFEPEVRDQVTITVLDGS